MDDANIDFLKKQSLFKSFTDEELHLVARFLKRNTIESYDPIVEEGDLSSDIYFIAEGEVCVLKWDEAKLFQLPIGTLKEGDMFGEMSFLDLLPRSASIEARKNTVYYSLAREDLLGALPQTQEIYNKIVTNIAIINAQRLRLSNQSYVKTLRSLVGQLQIRIGQSLLVVYLAIMMGAMNFFELLNLPDFITPSPTVVTWLLWIVLLLPVLYTIRKFHYYLNEFGLTVNGLWKSLRETPIVGAVGFVGMLAIHGVAGSHLQKSSLVITSSLMYLGLYALYCFAVEFISRGVLQTLIKSVMKVEGRWSVIGVTSLLVTFIPLFSYAPLSLSVVGLTFAGNLCLGRVYSRHNNLTSVVLLHYFLGLFANYLGWM